MFDLDFLKETLKIKINMSEAMKHGKKQRV